MTAAQDWALRHLPLTRSALARLDTDGLQVALDMDRSAAAEGLAAALAEAGVTALWGQDADVVIGAAQVTINGTVHALDATALGHLYAIEIGLGQAAVMALLDITNLQIAGRPVGVIGYDPAGRSIAAHARAMGARVTVIDADPVAAVRALHDCHDVGDGAAVRTVDVVFVTSARAAALVMAHADHLRPDTLIANTSPHVGPRNFADLNPATDVRAHVTEHTRSDSSCIKLIAQGAPLQTAAAQGLPLEGRDVLFALALSTLHHRTSPDPLTAAERDVAADILTHKT
ncbi:Rossmann-fold NAD(P)-binding domain-containing protein [Pseudooctadecabacter jejudonensis]|uniref:Adenosylhomocysteinase n=1 Tax=Pseudooctadecabacter jejudonensis TaxID=1391910 RepID=A0A1Y5RYL1_9RHOB|nr:hypothetical protein [Pseudooctadecabacter jejudonensis]SLN27122.1 Adenosylhomocysteinase [Pseudooctadecabacter jejudonensis]